MLNRISILAASAAVMALATTGANAAVFNTGSFAFGGFVNLAGSSNNVTNVPLTIDLTSPAVNIGSPTGDFTSIVGTSVTSLTLGSNPLIFTTANAADFSFSNGLLGAFTASTVTENGPGCGSVGANAVCYSIFGAFTPGSAYSNNSPLAGGADEIWTLNQAGGAGHSISISGTFNAPAVTNIPEPLTISLFGAGLAGLGFGSRRRKAATKA